MTTPPPKDFIKDGLDNNNLIETIKKIRKVIEGGGSQTIEQKQSKLMEEYASFYERYPMLFDMAIKEEPFDWNSFNYFIHMRTKIINDELTSEDASKIVGQNWYDKHINVEDTNKKRKMNHS
jgi:hypothetical protein